MSSLIKWQESENARTGAIPIQLREGAIQLWIDRSEVGFGNLTPAAFASLASQGGSPSSTRP
jgi:hypothetical protein